MPEWSVLAVFIPTVVVICLTPGPDVLYVLANGIGRGARAGVVSALGIATAMLVHTTAAALGLSYLFAESAWAFSAVKYAGGTYLIYLGIRAILGGTQELSAPGEAAPIPLLAVLRQGFVTNLLNPKIIVFFAAFLPQFVTGPASSSAGQLLVLGLLFTLIGLLVDAAIGVASGRAGTLLTGRRLTAVVLNWFSGIVFIGLGVRLLFTRPS